MNSEPFRERTGWLWLAILGSFLIVGPPGLGDAKYTEPAPLGANRACGARPGVGEMRAAEADALNNVGGLIKEKALSACVSRMP